ERTLGQRDGVADRTAFCLEETRVPVRRRTGHRRVELFRLDDRLAAQPDRVSGVAAVEVRSCQRDRELHCLVRTAQVRPLELLAHALADLDRGVEVPGLAQAATQSDRALHAEQSAA